MSKSRGPLSPRLARGDGGLGTDEGSSSRGVQRRSGILTSGVISPGPPRQPTGHHQGWSQLQRSPPHRNQRGKGPGAQPRQGGTRERPRNLFIAYKKDSVSLDTPFIQTQPQGLTPNTWP